MREMRSFFKRLKKFSIGALSQQLPLRLIAQVKPYSTTAPGHRDCNTGHLDLPGQ
jgi:hypothetical protein